MSSGLVQLRDELGVYQRRIVVLEKEEEEIALKLQEQEATIQAKPALSFFLVILVGCRFGPCAVVGYEQREPGLERARARI